MKRTFLFMCLAVIAMGSCKKKSDNTTVTPVVPVLPTYTVDGIHDIVMSPSDMSMAILTMPITVQFQDSFQKQVTLSLSGVPAGIAIDTTWSTTGYPTFSTMLTFYDTATISAAVGTYPLTLTATGAAGTKTFTFNLKVLPANSCADYIPGAYSSCSRSCISGPGYADSIYEDFSVKNKFWITNFYKTGQSAYVYYNCLTHMLYMPAQAINGVTYFGTGTASGSTSTNHHVVLNLSVGGTSCNVYMDY